MTYVLLALIIICDMWILFRIVQMLRTGALRLNDRVWRWRTDPVAFFFGLAVHVLFLLYGLRGLSIELGLKFHG